MINAKTAFSSQADPNKAVEEIARQLKQSNTKLVMFFASTAYDFELISRLINNSFLECEVIGCTTSGEISNNGFTNNSITAVGIASDDFIPATVVIEDIATKPILSRDYIIETFNGLGLKTKDPSIGNKAFGLLLVDGLQSAEEKVLSVINSVFDDNPFPIVGGSAGDDRKFDKTFVSLNGRTYHNAAVFTIVKTSHKFYTYKENIFEPMNGKLMVTKADVRSRKIYEIDGKPAVKAYAEKLGITESSVKNSTFKHPVAKIFNENVYTSSFMDTNSDGSFNMYCNVFPHTLINVMKPMNPIEVTKNTVVEIKKEIPEIEIVLCFNCILRLIQFEEEGLCKPISNELSKLGKITGFTTYGEQYYKMHINQTMSMIAIGK